MFATLAALFSSTAVHECNVGEAAHQMSGNPVKDCIEPVLNHIMSYLAEAAICTTNARRLDSNEEDLWYRAPDFERFKRDMVNEALNAGCFEPVAQYRHIKTKYIDEVTMRNTEQNVSPMETDNEEAVDTDVVETPTIKPRRHRRSVSFDLNDPKLSFIRNNNLVPMVA
eukprot:m.127923 g.127923  ORF g.127923 m.127923 type:complete len:169 (-) comp29304_c0_seq4:87-593(-)